MNKFSLSLFDMTMKIYILLVQIIFLVGCVESTTKNPLIGLNLTPEKISIVNVYPHHIYTFNRGKTVFGNKLSQKHIPDLNVAEFIEIKLRNIFTQLYNIKITDLMLSETDVSYLEYDQKNESLITYQNKIKNIPEILKKARKQEIEKLLLIAPSSVNIYDTTIYTPATGLRYSNGKIIEAYSSVNIYFIDTKTNEIIGKHSLTNDGNLVTIDNVLTEEEIIAITENHQKEERLKQATGENNTPSYSLEFKLSRACAQLSNFDRYNKQNLDSIKTSITNSLDILLSRIESIYLGTSAKKQKNWRTTRSSSISSCKV